jgi:murein DD-endopeptidase MepM/ murein hydrolase activator NlpD
MRKIGLALALFLLFTLMGTPGVSAQDASNLLINGGLEEDTFGSYTGRRGGEFPIYLPSGWNYWMAGTTGERYNRGDKTTIQPHPGPGPSPREGRRAVDVDCGFFTCTVALYQQVGNITPNTNVQASAFATLHACDLAKDSKGNIIASDCGSAVESGAQTRIGIDPNGGADPNDSDIVWSGFIAPHIQNGWQPMSVSATATGTTVTLFLYSTQASFADINKTYWDQVVLSGGGAGGAAAGAATPVPTAPPFVPFVVTQGEQPDGSIVHTVQAGDTIDSIAYAYGVSRTDIMQLNNIKDPRIIQLGQKLLIKPAPGGADNANETPEATSEAQATTESGLPVIGAVPQATEEVQSEVPTEQAPVQVQPTVQSSNPEATAPVVVANAGALDPASTTASVCVLLFNDADQNRIQEQGEDLLKGGTISIQDSTAAVGTYETDGTSEPHCFEELPAGEYTAAVTAPDGYGLTTPNQLRLLVNPGTVVNLSFGAAQGVQAAPIPTSDSAAPVAQTVTEETAPQRSLADQLLSISGLIVFGLAAVVLLGGVGVALFMRRR